MGALCVCVGVVCECVLGGVVYEGASCVWVCPMLGCALLTMCVLEMSALFV